MSGERTNYEAQPAPLMREKRLQEEFGIDPHLARIACANPVALTLSLILARYQLGENQPTGISSNELLLTWQALHNFPLEDIIATHETTPHRPRQPYAIQALAQDVPPTGWHDMSRATILNHLAVLTSAQIAQISDGMYQLSEEAVQSVRQREQAISHQLQTNPFALYKTFWGTSSPIEASGYPQGFLERLLLTQYVLSQPASATKPLAAVDIAQHLQLDVSYVLHELSRLDRMGILTSPQATERQGENLYTTPASLQGATINMLPPVPKRTAQITDVVRSVVIGKAGHDRYTIQSLTAEVITQAKAQSIPMDEEKVAKIVEDCLRFWAGQEIIGVTIARRTAHLTNLQRLELENMFAFMFSPTVPSQTTNILCNPSMFQQIAATLQAEAQNPRPNTQDTAAFDQALMAILQQQTTAGISIEQILQALGQNLHQSFSREAVLKALDRLSQQRFATTVPSEAGRGVYYVSIQEQISHYYNQLEAIGTDSTLTKDALAFVQAHATEAATDRLLLQKLLPIAIQLGLLITTSGRILGIGPDIEHALIQFVDVTAGDNFDFDLGKYYPAVFETRQHLRTHQQNALFIIRQQSMLSPIVQSQEASRRREARILEDPRDEVVLIKHPLTFTRSIERDGNGYSHVEKTVYHTSSRGDISPAIETLIKAIAMALARADGSHDNPRYNAKSPYIDQARRIMHLFTPEKRRNWNGK